MREIIATCDTVAEAVLLEAKEATTAILLLDSPEPDVLATSCRALYKHAEKNDDNKLSLFNLKAIEKLVPLIQHADPRVRCFSLMTLASLSKLSDIRRFLRNDKETLAIIVALLNMDYDTPAILESATLYLASLSIDFSTKVFLCEFEVLEPLVRCLSINDPDVQMNAMQTIALLMQDFTCRAAMLKAVDGFKAIVKLLKTSEFPITQYYTLLALQEASKDADVRSELCDIGIIQTLVDYISRSDTERLHVFALAVLANCTEHAKSHRIIKECGGLIKLVSLLGDSRKGATTSGGMTSATSGSVQDDERKGKKEVKQPGATGVIKGGNNKKIEDPSKEAIYPQVANPPPDMLSSVALAIAYSAKSGQNARVMHEKGVEEKLVTLLSHHDRPEVQTSAAVALAVLSVHESCRKSIMKADGLNALGTMLKSNRLETVEAALLAVANLAVGNPQAIEPIANAGIPTILVQRLQSTVNLSQNQQPQPQQQPKEQTKADKQQDKHQDKEKDRGASVVVLNESGLINAVHIITALSVDVTLRQEFNRMLVVNRLLDVLQSSRSARVHGVVAATLASLVIDAEARNQVVSTSGGLEVLVQLLCSSDLSVIKHSSWILSTLASDITVASELYSLGALPILRDIVKSPSRCSSFSQRLLARIINCNLPEKYAHSGFLSSEDVIYDGFYDPGQLREDEPLKSLQEYSQQDYNSDLRPVLLVNPKPLQPVTSQMTLPLVESTSDTRLAGKPTGATAGGRVSRSSSISTAAGRDSRKKASGTVKTDSKQKLNEDFVSPSESSESLPPASLVGGEVKDYQIPGDTELWQCLEYCTCSLSVARSASTLVEQIAFIACFVQDRMGGVLNDTLKSSWFNHIQQLKSSLASNIIPIGYIKHGIQCHRALLFKALANRLGIQCSLVRGDYNRAWNEVMLTEGDISDLEQLENEIGTCTCDTLLTRWTAMANPYVYSQSIYNQSCTEEIQRSKEATSPKGSKDSLENSAAPYSVSSKEYKKKSAADGAQANANSDNQIINDEQGQSSRKNTSSRPVKYIINLTVVDAIGKVFMRCDGEAAELYKREEQTMYSCHKPI